MDELRVPSLDIHHSLDVSLEVAACVDRVMVTDSRVLVNMLAEERRLGLVDYCTTGGGQSLIKPHMRKIVVDWMLEVVEDHGCVAHVFHTAVSYLDRYLSVTATLRPLPKQSFQSLAAGCLLVASKFCEVRPISSQKLSLYTDHSVSGEEVREWEMRLLSSLGWDMSSVTVQSFLELLASQSVTTKPAATRHAEILAATALTEYKFLLVRPSLMAAAALAAASRGLNLAYALPPVLQPEAATIAVLVDHLEALVQSYKQYTPSSASSTSTQQSSTATTAAVSSSAACNPGKLPPPAAAGREGTLTPTDCHQISAFVGA